MKPRLRARPSVERLEDRWCPSVTASLDKLGNLVIRGGSATLQVTQTAAGTFHVVDAGTDRGSFTPTRNVRINLGSGDDNVTLDLGGFTFAHSVAVNLGKGANSLSVVNGSISGYLSAEGYAGKDTFTLGDGTNALTVHGAILEAEGGATGTFTLSAKATVQDDLVTEGVNNVTLAAGSSVGDNAVILGGRAGNTVDVAGSVAHDLLFFGSPRSDVKDTFTLEKGATVGHDLTAYTDGIFGFFSGGDDTVTLDGSIGHNVYLDTGKGNDTVTFGADLTVSGKAVVYLGDGNDTFNYNTTQSNLKAYLDGGRGTDTFNLGAGITLPATVIKKNFE